MNQEKIGRFIAQARKKKGYTQEQLAEKLGVNKPNGFALGKREKHA